jgi:8-oxo-dGTP pyrophosphatase MutT (NUDIX family)
MHRQRLLSLIDDYARRWPDEAAVVERFRTFVDAHPRCFERDCWTGHVTGSAWVTNHAGDAVLLTHHKKLDRWLQLGGHSDGDPDPLAVARREAEEEGGLAVVAVWQQIFDLDVHEIPARKGDPAHYHYDVRFAFRPIGSEAFAVSEESHDLAWVPIAGLDALTDETSMLRMAGKWLAQKPLGKSP